MSKKINADYTLSQKMKGVVRKLIYDMQNKWHQVHRTEQYFLNTFGKWLDSFVVFVDDDLTRNSSQKGRPPYSFTDSSERTKRKKTADLRAHNTSDELAYAAQMSFRADGNLDAAFVIKDITEGTPSRSKRYRNSIKQIAESTLTGDEALSLLIENKLSKSQYNGIRKVSKEKSSKLYPHYRIVYESKQKCYPDDTKILVHERGATVELQALLDHTVNRILIMQSDVIKSRSAEQVSDLELICKWGGDGTSGQSNYKQRSNEQNEIDVDSSIFFFSLVPLQLHQKSDHTTIIWKNPRPSSPRYCRPIEINFCRETVDSTQKKIDAIEVQKKNLKPYETTIDEKKVKVDFNLILTMVDGKVCNSLSNTSSSMRCYLCQATSSQFNDIDKMLEKSIPQNKLQYLNFGISSLHAWIRFFECCLHVSYRIKIKSWQVRKGDKNQVDERKKDIQKKFRDQLGLIVDQPKPGYGSSNDGNTARRFFENSEISSRITEVNKDVIDRFHVILQVVSSGFAIDVVKFHEFAIETARKFVELYSWFSMPTTVHKILLHGSIIIETSLLPIGQMSEEAQESCNKLIKRYREDYARKCSRSKNIEDVFRRLLVSSDPFITSLRELPPKKGKSFSPLAAQLLISPSVVGLSDTNVNDSEYENSEYDSDTE